MLKRETKHFVVDIKYSLSDRLKPAHSQDSTSTPAEDTIGDMETSSVDLQPTPPEKPTRQPLYGCCNGLRVASIMADENVYMVDLSVDT